jgi:tetratricopeptide (TPR) repeat protein
VPQRLPAGVIVEGQFAGRAAELAALSALLRKAGADGTVTVAAITGAAGVGKTALAVHWARTVATEFPDGQLYVNLGGFGQPGAPMDPGEAAASLLRALGTTADQIPASRQERCAHYRRLLAGRRMLLILDNARDEEQVRPLLPGAPGCMVIVTSRNEPADLLPGSTRLLTLDVLAEADARDLLARALGTTRLAADPTAVNELTSVCARLPLALAITAAQARARPQLTLATLAMELRDTKGPDALDTDDPAASVRAVFTWSCQNLSQPAAEMFRLLWLHPGPDIAAPAAASLSGLPVSRARELLGELCRGHLLTEHTPGRYAHHDLLRAYAAEQAATMDETTRHAALARVLDHYLHTAHRAAYLLNPLRELVSLTPAGPGVTPEPLAGHQQALAWFEAERQVLLSAITVAAGAGFEAHAWQLPWAMSDFLDWRGDRLDWAAVNRAALAVATRAGDISGQAVTTRLVAHAVSRAGDFEQARAYLTDCLALCQRVGDRSLAGRVYLTLCSVSVKQDRHFDALNHAEQALSLFREIGDQPGEAAALNNIGYCHLELGDRRLARTFCEEAMAICRRSDNVPMEACTWESLGEIESQFGRYADAADCYQHALSLYQGLGDRRSEGVVLTHLGDNQNAAGDRGLARDTWQRALVILDNLQHPEASGVRRRLRGV